MEAVFCQEMDGEVCSEMERSQVEGVDLGGLEHDFYFPIYEVNSNPN